MCVNIVLPRVRGLSVGSSVEVEGLIVESSHSGQTVELLANTLQLLGPCNPQVCVMIRVLT